MYWKATASRCRVGAPCPRTLLPGICPHALPAPGINTIILCVLCSALQKPARDHQVISVAFDDATKPLQTLGPRKRLLVFLLFLLCHIYSFFLLVQCMLEVGVRWGSMILSRSVRVPAVQRRFPSECPIMSPAPTCAFIP